MHREALPAAEGNAGEGVVLRVADARRPGLRFEVAAGRRMLIRQGDAVVALGSVDQPRCGVHIHRTGEYVSPLPAPDAATARRIGAGPIAGWHARWACQFAGELEKSRTGPLHRGRWLLHQVRLPQYGVREDLVRDYPDAYLDWLAGWNGVVPLCRLPTATDGRVKAYRKQARDETLPPVLLWTASGLDGFLLLDGHARLVAADLEEVDPRILVLSLGQHPDDERAALEQAAARYEYLGRYPQSASAAGTAPDWLAETERA